MLLCKFCDKECKNTHSLTQHQIRCKDNPLRININYNDYNDPQILYCKFCEKECKNKNSLVQHQIRCKDNPNRIFIKNNLEGYKMKVKKGLAEPSNQYIKAKKLGLPKPEVSDETRKKLSLSSKNRKWTDEMRENHSKAMLKAVERNPESYSSKNVSGRCKHFYVTDSYNNDVVLKGTWELLVSDLLNSLDIKWTNIIEEKIYYIWEDKKRRYYPDFYLEDYNLYIEVKGYEREVDKEKWKSVSNLLILKKDEIECIKKEKFNIVEKIKEFQL